MNQICLIICCPDVGSKFAVAAGGHGVFPILRLMFFRRLLRSRTGDERWEVPRVQIWWDAPPTARWPASCPLAQVKMSWTSPVAFSMYALNTSSHLPWSKASTVTFAVVKGVFFLGHSCKNVSLVQKSRRTSIERSFLAECPWLLLCHLLVFKQCGVLKNT
jgi:hypothetical protein